jgi:60 kDa SS-A/Ro ribonucleoprotein
MGAKYSDHLKSENTPQSEKVDPRQVLNSAGGYTFQIDPFQRLERFLILGAEGGTYYASERKLVIENAGCVRQCLDDNPIRAVHLISDISQQGRAPKNDAAVFALALAAAHPSPAVRELALDALPVVCRIGTHLFQFVEAVDSMRGWGRGLRRGLSRWYESKTPEQLAYQVLKYQARNKWSHRDVLRLAHLTPRPKEPTVPQLVVLEVGTIDGVLPNEVPTLEQIQAHYDRKTLEEAAAKPPVADRDLKPDNQSVYRWVIGAELGERHVVRKSRGVTVQYPAVTELPPLLAAYEALKTETELSKVLAAIRAHKLTHEMIPGTWKSRAEVWEALSEHMPMHALVRNLANLTAKGVIAPLSDNTKRLANQLHNRDAIGKSRLHPIALLSALRVYEQGKGLKGSLTWVPDQHICAALSVAFYLAFQNVVPTGKKHLLALDVSGSMGDGEIAGVPGLSPREASAAMALVTMRTEPEHHVVAFTGGHTPGFAGFGRRFFATTAQACTPLPIFPEMTLKQVIDTISGLPFGPTDIAQPMLYALENGIPVEAIVIYTDSETWCGEPHPHVALKMLRMKTGVQVKLAVCAMTATDFTVADPQDVNSLDIVGFDTATPSILADFVRS